ncbi:hypothetical protein HPP92_000508 [Vanilla planifolia]|uniref:C2 NT-type domain-containing protein n=1 Tax=Vanilla planifolia TaxID=51239 RepID=A0A835RY63_VANPL|nr:hypothetical protein HPP92_000508 [Vanilla planifolia]
MRGVEPMKDPSNGRFFREIEALSKALDVDAKRIPRRGRAPALPGSRSASAGRSLAPSDSHPKEKKPSSLWNWKPLKALSHIRHRRFECVFSLRVHSIENVPLSLADASLCVNWRRNTVDAGLVHSRPARVFRGVSVFQDTLTYNCSVYGSRSGAQGTAKYEARNFLLYATVVGAPGLDLGKHRVDLTRLLPLNLEELEEETSCGSWSTSFRLSGKASGATLNVSFGFSVVGGNDKVGNSGGVGKMPEILAEKGDRMNAIRRTDSLPGLKSRLVDEALLEIKETSGNVISREAVSSVEEKVMEARNDSPEMKCCLLPEPCFRDAKESDWFENSVIEHGIEISKEDVANLAVIKMLNSEKVIVQDCSEVEVINTAINQMQYESSFSSVDTKEMDFLLGESSAKELDSTIHAILCHESTEMRNPEQKIEIPGKMTFDGVGQFEEGGSLKMRSQSLDDLTEEVANEFLSMLDFEQSSPRLSSEGDPESPKEQLWKQFEMDSIISNDGLLILEMGADQEMKWGNSGSEVFDFSSMVHDASSSNQEPVQAMECKSMAQMLEDAETEALLCEWGLDETVFEGPPTDIRGGFGSPIHLLPEETTELPPLGENLGPFVQTKDGGFLRSMCPSLFKGSKSNGKLIMQVSKPVVMPAEMGSDVMGILKHLASVGVEKLSMQAGQLMPLEEITGSSMQQLAWEASPCQSGHDSPLQPYREDELGYDLKTFGKKGKPFNPVSERSRESNNEYVSLEDLAPLAMDKIEALSIEGLKIQSGMSDEEVLSNTTKQFVGEMPTFEEQGVQNLISLGMEGAVGLQLLDVKGKG